VTGGRREDLGIYHRACVPCLQDHKPNIIRIFCARGKAGEKSPTNFDTMPCMNNDSIKTRFAPSPTGMLHLGSARTALFNWLPATQRQGVFPLHIEDTDADRSSDDYAKALQQALQWLGLPWREGPGIFGLQESYQQSQRGGMCRNYFDLLEQQGLACHCFCSEQELKMVRKSQLAAGQAPRYPGTCAQLSRDEVVRRLEQGRRQAEDSA